MPMNCTAAADERRGRHCDGASRKMMKVAAVATITRRVGSASGNGPSSVLPLTGPVPRLSGADRGVALRYGMTDAQKPGAAAIFYLDDLHVGQRFTSGSHVLDEAQIKRFAT